jgi:two-component system, OmpR family, response regulator
MARILIIDDDPHIRELVRYFLTRTGFAVVEAADGPAALRLLEGTTVECVILDIMMPKMDGWELCQLLKAYFDFPILMLTAKGETAQKVKGLNLGADDYMAKPFDTEELLARVRALLRRYKIDEAKKVQVGSVVLDLDAREVVIGAERATIPLKEFELLFKLASKPGTTFSRDQIVESVWGMDFNGNERTIDVHINRLRERFPEERCGFRITTVRGLGYRLEVST